MKSGLAATVIAANSFFSFAMPSAGATSILRAAQLGIHIPATAVPSINISNDIACNRLPPAGLPVEFVLLRGCAPTPLLSGGDPYAWPKYDPMRRVLLVSLQRTAGYRLYAIDESGSILPFNPPGLPQYDPRGIAPVGDGRIYFTANSALLSYIDANDAPHVVLDWNGVPYINQDAVTDIVHDDISHSLILLSSTSGMSHAVVSKLELNTAGDRLLGPPVRYAFNSPGNTSVPRIARHPDGRLLLRVFDTVPTPNGTLQVEWLDTIAMAVHPFCTPTLNPQTAFRNECAYSAALGGVIGITTNIPCGQGCTPVDTLRVFPEGHVGPGISVCSWSNQLRQRFVEFVW